MKQQQPHVQANLNPIVGLAKPQPKQIVAASTSKPVELMEDRNRILNLQNFQQQSFNNSVHRSSASLFGPQVSNRFINNRAQFFLPLSSSSTTGSLHYRQRGENGTMRYFP